MSAAPPYCEHVASCIQSTRSFDEIRRDSRDPQGPGAGPELLESLPPPSLARLPMLASPQLTQAVGIVWHYHMLGHKEGWPGLLG